MFVSIAVEPLYPQICQKEMVYTPIDDKESISPINLARILNSIACSLSVKREDPISVYHLIMEARHYMLSLWNTGKLKQQGVNHGGRLRMRQPRRHAH